MRARLWRAARLKMLALAFLGTWAVSVYELPQLLGLNRF